MQIVLQALETKTLGWFMSSYILRRNFCSLSPICQTWQNFKDTKGGIQFELKYINLGVYRQ